MPKETIDYSNTIIYKIYCKDETIKDLYVGHTTNFQQRKYRHKIACNNNKTDIKIYNVIRENGGWENWDMIEIAQYNCKNSTEARIKEHEHYNVLKASLNSCPPFVDKSKYFCDICNLQCSDSKKYETHIKCNLHIKKIPNPHKIPDKYYCKICEYDTSNFKDYKKHNLTQKHIRNTTATISNHLPTEKILNCELCNKAYKDRTGLWKHKQKCIGTHEKEELVVKEETTVNEETINKHDKMIEYLMKENKEMKELILEILKKRV